MAMKAMKATKAGDPKKTMKAMKLAKQKKVALKTAKVTMKARDVAAPGKPKDPSWYFVDTRNIREVLIEFGLDQNKIKVWKLDGAA